jgi:type IV secretory pathway protease TraF
MVAIAFKGASSVTIGKYKFVKGETEVADADFYELMKLPNFAARVKSHTFQVPYGFPLEKQVVRLEDDEIDLASDKSDKTDKSEKADEKEDSKKSKK